MAELKFDGASFEATARAVIKHNPHAKGYSVPDMLTEMKRVAYETEPCGYVGTRGFVLSFYNCETGEVGVKASVDAVVLDL